MSNRVPCTHHAPPLLVVYPLTLLVGTSQTYPSRGVETDVYDAGRRL